MLVFIGHSNDESGQEGQTERETEILHHIYIYIYIVVKKGTIQTQIYTLKTMHNDDSSVTNFRYFSFL